MELYRACERINIAQLLIDLVNTIHRSGRMAPPKRTNLGGEIELILVASVVLTGHMRGRFKTASDVARTLTIPRITARRKLEELVSRGLLAREGTRYRITDTDDKKKFVFLDAAHAIVHRAAKRCPK